MRTPCRLKLNMAALVLALAAATPATATTLLFDGFDGPALGAAWTTLGDGSYSLASGLLSISSGPSGERVDSVATFTPAPGYVLSMESRVAITTPLGGGGLVWYFTNDTQTLAFGFHMGDFPGDPDPLLAQRPVAGQSPSTVILGVDTSQFHVYRAEYMGGSQEVRFYVDGVLKAADAIPVAINEPMFIRFNPIGPANSMRVDWVRIESTLVPEPAGLLLGFAGFLGAAVARRRGPSARHPSVSRNC